MPQFGPYVRSMSTLTSARPRRGTRHDNTAQGTATARARIVSGPLALVFLSEFCALTSFYLLLSVTPRNTTSKRSREAEFMSVQEQSALATYAVAA